MRTNLDLFGPEQLRIQVRVGELRHLSSPLRAEQLRGPPSRFFMAGWRNLYFRKRQKCGTDQPALRQVPLMVWRSRLHTIPIQLSQAYVNQRKALGANEVYHIPVNEISASLEGNVGEYAGGGQVTVPGRCGVCRSMRRHSAASV